jgi:outer membrane protein TolC
MKMKLIAFAVICAVCLSAQAPVEPQPSFFQKLKSPWTDPRTPAFPSPSYFKKVFSTPSSHIELQPPARLADYLQDGKLVLSLKAYLDLVMANNTDVSIQRLTVERSQNNLYGSFSKFDPTVGFNLNHQRSTSTSTDRFDQVSQLKNLTQASGLTYTQLLPSGTTLNAGMNLGKTTSNSANNTNNPNLTGSFSADFSQPLLRGRSLDMVRLQITQARINLRSAVLGNKDSMMGYVQTAETAYWDVVGARDSLRVAEAALELQQISMNRSDKMLELGAMAELDIYQPRAQLEQSRIQVSQAKFSLMRAEDALRRQMGADLDPAIRSLPIELTESVAPPEDTTVLDREALVQMALSNRPDLARALLTLQMDDLNLKQSVNNLRPQLTFTGSYSGKGTSGTRYGSDCQTCPINPIPLTIGGFSDALGTAFARENPTYGFGLRLSLPLRDRAASSNLANSLLTKKSDTLALRKSEQGIRLEVLNAVTALESSRESVKLSKVQRDLAAQDRESWQKKFDLGTTEMYFVLDSQNRLATAESNLSNAYIQYHRNELTLQRVTGELLERRGIVVE